MPMPAAEITRRIKALLPDSEVELKDLAGDDDHWQVTVASAAFKDKTRVQQHKLVYQAIGSDMGGALHALAVVTKVK